MTVKSGSMELPALASQIMKSMKNTFIQKVSFKSEGILLCGDLHLPVDFDRKKKYPALIVSGSWTTVKEQMAGLYAKRLAHEGFIALAFDFRNFGESEGQPRFYENPNYKKEDIKNAITFLSEQIFIDNNKLGAFGVCAGAMYTLMAASEDTRIKVVVTAASWLHDSEAVKLFYGGAPGVQAKIEAANASKDKFTNNGIVDYVPTISETDPQAAMYGRYDYYLNPKRGAIPQWSADNSHSCRGLTG